jgi:hypothetical protein
VLADSPTKDSLPRGSLRRTAPPPAETKHESRWPVLSVAVVAVVLLVILTVLVWRIFATGGQERESSPALRAGSGATQASYGQESDVTITGTGALDGVTHLVLEHPIPSLAVTVMTPSPGTSLSVYAPIISDLRVIADGQLIKSVDRALPSGGHVKLPLPPGTRTVDLSYHADGVVHRSEPSVQGRASVLVTPLIVQPTNDLYVSINIHSPYVSNTGCSSAGEAPVGCGTGTSDGWSVTSAPEQGAVDVIAQVTLPTG